MKRFPAKLAAQRWVKAVRQLLGGVNHSPAVAPKAPSVRLGVEVMEDRVTPAQIGQFSFASNND